MPASPHSVVFVCGQNAVRSPIAAALARRVDPFTLYVASAGVVAGERDPFVEAILQEIGLSAGSARPKALDDLEDLNFDLAVTLSPEAHHRMMELTRTHAIAVEYWPTPDPTLTIGTREQIVSAYRDLRNLLAGRVAARFAPGEPVHTLGRMG